MAKKRMTPRKEAILRMLESDYDAFDRDDYRTGFGRHPYNATTIASYIDLFGGNNGALNSAPCEPVKPSDSIVQSFARTLRGMVQEGLLVQVCEKQQTSNAIARDVVDMPRTCYYSARTIARDVAANQALQAAKDAAAARYAALTPEQREAADRAMFGAMFGAKVQPAPAQLPSDVIDGCITEVSRPNDTTSAGQKYIPF